jgi:glutamyl-tRNA synthetase
VDGPSSPFEKELPRHKKNAELGTKPIVFSSKLFLEQQDAITLQVNEEVTLMDWGNAIIKEVETKDRVVQSVKAILHLEGDFKKTKLKLTWLSQENKAVEVCLLDYDFLITKKKLEEEDKIEDFVTPVTEFVVFFTNLDCCHR